MPCLGVEGGGGGGGCGLFFFFFLSFFFQAEDGIRYLVRSRGLGDVYKRQVLNGIGRGVSSIEWPVGVEDIGASEVGFKQPLGAVHRLKVCLLYTSDAADERSSVDLGGRRIIKKKHKIT